MEIGTARSPPPSFLKNDEKLHIVRPEIHEFEGGSPRTAIDDMWNQEQEGIVGGICRTEGIPKEKPKQGVQQ